MTGPRLGQGMPQDASWFARQIEDLRRQVSELRSAIPLGLTSRNFDGTINPLAPGTQGWALDGDGDAAFSGNTVIGGNLTVDGTLVLPNASVNNAALVSPAAFAVANVEVSNLTFNATTTTYASQSIAVPAGYTNGLVTLTVYAQGMTVGVDRFISVWARIAGVQGLGAAQTATDAGSLLSCSTTYARSLTGLSGSVLVEARANTGFAGNITTGSGTVALTASVVFLR